MSKTQELGYLMEEEVSLIPNLPRRVRNLALGPTTPSNALVPIFEAVYNAIHAISDRFGSDWCERGSVTIFLHNFGSDDFSVEIQDNGIGLDEENFASFRTYDSDWKSSRGGKGVGRLAWLKVFHEAHIRSLFMVKDVLFERSFDFVLDDLRPIKRMKVAPVDLSLNSQAQPGTIVMLRHMRTEYVRHMPVMVDTVLRKIVAHFLPYLISANFPEIVLETRDESFNLGEFLSEKKVELGTLPVETIKGDDKGLKIVHNLLERGLVEGKASHKLYFAAHDRVVGEFDIGTTLGLTTYIEGGGNKHVYAGILSGELLDKMLTLRERASILIKCQLTH